MAVRWIRPRYGQAPNRFHAERSRTNGSYRTECVGGWSTSEVTEELVDDGKGSGEYATEKCRACVKVIEAAKSESAFSGEGG